MLLYNIMLNNFPGSNQSNWAKLRECVLKSGRKDKDKDDDKAPATQDQGKTAQTSSGPQKRPKIIHTMTMPDGRVVERFSRNAFEDEFADDEADETSLPDTSKAPHKPLPPKPTKKEQKLQKKNKNTQEKPVKKPRPEIVHLMETPDGSLVERFPRSANEDEDEDDIYDSVPESRNAPNKRQPPPKPNNKQEKDPPKEAPKTADSKQPPLPPNVVEVKAPDGTTELRLEDNPFDDEFADDESDDRDKAADAPAGSGASSKTSPSKVPPKVPPRPQSRPGSNLKNRNAQAPVETASERPLRKPQQKQPLPKSKLDNGSTKAKPKAQMPTSRNMRNGHHVKQTLGGSMSVSRAARPDSFAARVASQEPGRRSRTRTKSVPANGVRDTRRTTQRK